MKFFLINIYRIVLEQPIPLKGTWKKCVIAWDLDFLNYNIFHYNGIRTGGIWLNWNVYDELTAFLGNTQRILMVQIDGKIYHALGLEESILSKWFYWSSHHGSVEMTLTSIHEDTDSIPVGFSSGFSGLRIWCCRDLWCTSQTWLGSVVAAAVA